ncbi:hypothetical protein V6N13_014309 [Hibiscus sabdariffa]
MDFVLNKIDKHLDNHMCFDQYWRDLKRKLKALNGLKEDIDSTLSIELRPRKKLKAEVQIWLENVDRINCDVQDLDGRIQESNALARGFHAEDVLKNIEEVSQLIIQRGKFHGGLVVDNPQWIGQVLSTTNLSGEAVKACVEEIWQCLMDDEIPKIGLWGMGGVGKTSIMKVINNQLLKQTGKFDIVIWITASKEMSIAKLQKDIASKIGVEFCGDEDETTRAGMLFERFLRKSRFVMILDDLWEKVSLERIGIPEPFVGSKLVLTTRSSDVCRQVGCRVIKVKPLMEEEAWKLFLEKVGRDILNIPGVEPIARSMARRCADLENVPSLSHLQVLRKLDLQGTNIKEIPHGMENLVSLEYLNLYYFNTINEIPKGILSRLSSLQNLIVGETLISGKEVGGLKKLEILRGRFHDWHNLHMYLQAFHGRREEPLQYIIFVGDVLRDAVGNDARKVIVVRGCNIHTYQIMLPRDIEALHIWDCNLEFREEYPLFSRFILFSPASFSSLEYLHLYYCGNMKKLFSPNCVPLKLRELRVFGCKQVEEVIASEGGMVTMEIRLPRLWKLRLCDLPELKRICSVGGVLVCGSLNEIEIRNCLKLKRMALKLLQLDNVQLRPSGCLSLRIYIKPKEWWETVEWDGPDAKNCPRLERMGLSLPQRDNVPPSASAPPCRSIGIRPKEWWESVEWDAKPLSEPFVRAIPC